MSDGAGPRHPPGYALDVWLGTIHVGRAFLDAGEGWRPISLGQIGDLMVTGEGVLPIHAWVVARGGVVYAASAVESTPALLFEQPLAATWTQLPVPCVLRLGTAIVQVIRLPASRRAAAAAIAASPSSGSDYPDEEPTVRRLSTPRERIMAESLEDAVTVTSVDTPRPA
ncbi:MAG TPA: hypothetical protein VLT33_33990 [Labilithrix sp.]|nr:hypothetical protein [Labilithrix sp.]